MIRAINGVWTGPRVLSKIKFMEKKNNIYGTLKTATWIAGFLVLILGGYVRWGLPHGPMLNMGEDCQEVDYRGHMSCGDRYVEDTRRLNIPDWAKFMK